MSQAAINKIITDAVFRQNAQKTVDGITDILEKYADAGISKAVATELTIGHFQAKGLFHLSGAVRVIAGEVYKKHSRTERRKRATSSFKKLFLR